MTTPNFQPLPPPDFKRLLTPNSVHTQPPTPSPVSNSPRFSSSTSTQLPEQNPVTYIPPQQPISSQHSAREKKTPVGAIIFGCLFFIMLLVTGYFAFNLFVVQSQLNSAKTQTQTVEQEKEELQKQVDAKETFGAVTKELFGLMHTFDGMPYKEYFPTEEADKLIQDAYVYRSEPDYVAVSTQQMQSYVNELKTLRSEMDNEKGSNSSGDVTEGKIDELSGGMTRSSYYMPPENPCEGEASACVWSNEPRVVHFNLDAFNYALEARGSSFTEWWKTGVAYHEFAHVLQNINPNETDQVTAVFNNDWELMADCFAGVYWGGDEMISYSYNRGCTGTQKQVVKEWYSSLTFATPSISQR